MLVQHGRLISGDVADVRVERGVITAIGIGLAESGGEPTSCCSTGWPT